MGRKRDVHQQRLGLGMGYGVFSGGMGLGMVGVLGGMAQRFVSSLHQRRRWLRGGGLTFLRSFFSSLFGVFSSVLFSLSRLCARLWAGQPRSDHGMNIALFYK